MWRSANFLRDEKIVRGPVRTRAHPGLRAAAAGLALTLSMLAFPLPTDAAQSGVVFLYQRFGKSGSPAGRIGLDQFEKHLEEIASGRYNVVPLGDIVAAFRRRDTLADRTVAISIDGADASIYAEAWPRLRRLGLPFTIFIATEPIDAGRRGQMNWEQIRELAASGVTIASQTANQLHLPELPAKEISRQINRAIGRIRDELGYPPKLFAYPFGAYGVGEKRQVREAGYIAAFGQQSGVGHPDADRYGLPRFLMNQRFGSLARFRLAANAQPLYLSDLTPADTVLEAATNPPPFGFTVAGDQGPLSALNCYAPNGPGPLQIERLGARRVEVRFAGPFPPGRGRINCTMPGDQRRWRWFGLQFYIHRK